MFSSFVDLLAYSLLCFIIVDSKQFFHLLRTFTILTTSHFLHDTQEKPVLDIWILNWITVQEATGFKGVPATSKTSIIFGYYSLEEQLSTKDNFVSWETCGKKWSHVCLSKLTELRKVPLVFSEQIPRTLLCRGHLCRGHSPLQRIWGHKMSKLSHWESITSPGAMCY